MAMISTLTSAYRAERATATPKRPRTPLLTHIGRFAARALPTWEGLRRFTLSVTGFGCLTAAAWTIALPAGLLTLGLSLLLLEYLTAERP
ncbi:hypothetical protein E1281_25960 [Actinomadura sp. KC345]|uniref:hypothetical protein n=1 Tax=Actinomadura sp. KC345 TaxID=2530371 RepID=UPI00104F06FB|nr:hypothetical protein [Actinomadura sp. KC345]TDC47649.1 hypothetical protein E1281_25960 [Actinomadura sp. KC345]